MAYQFLRIDRETIIKVPRKTLGTIDGPIFLFFGEKEDPNELPLEVRGECGEALKAWAAGREFPVVGNGICDIYGGVVLGKEASRALGGDKLTDVIVDSEDYTEDLNRPPLHVNLNAHQVSNGQPRIDFRKVEKRLRGE